VRAWGRVLVGPGGPVEAGQDCPFQGRNGKAFSIRSTLFQALKELTRSFRTSSESRPLNRSNCIQSRDLLYNDYAKSL
jgi:hypothetical protein